MLYLEQKVTTNIRIMLRFSSNLGVKCIFSLLLIYPDCCPNPVNESKTRLHSFLFKEEIIHFLLSATIH